MPFVIHARIRRDANTITPVTVRPHEVAILQTIHGEENVQNVDGQVLDLKALEAVDVAGEVPASEDEFNRLTSKYGGNEEGLLVEQVYGKRAAGNLDAAADRLDEAVAKIADAAGTVEARGRGRGRGRASAAGDAKKAADAAGTGAQQE
ncbi:MAG: hypothetical protein J0I68_30885 [Achromobacter sp.]|uniref:hypothetical protein n=1 Tax=unclassified Achromobacter TaxID=2626865 RepID=UPI0006C24337|nr:MULTISPECIES: hypothetical protein [unclassified Achromobacter]MBN9642971.1 hypothetical protein [Achromobacter sp.]CUJ80805.1 Uncharacterised protein [Achromobacter sp. 2789STDY5608628]